MFSGGIQRKNWFETGCSIVSRIQAIRRTASFKMIFLCILPKEKNFVIVNPFVYKIEGLLLQNFLYNAWFRRWFYPAGYFKNADTNSMNFSDLDIISK